jgi:hypothetical protein
LLVILLAILIGGGGFLFLYLSASSQGRKAAQATTRAITTSAALPAGMSSPIAEMQKQALDDGMPGPTRRLEETDDVPEVPLPDDAPTLVAATQPGLEDLDPTQAIASGTADLPPTMAVHAVEESAQDLPPTEAVHLSVGDPQAPTEALPAADRLPVEGLPTTVNTDIQTSAPSSEGTENDIT